MAADRNPRADFDTLRRVWCDQPLPPTETEETEMIDQAIRRARRFERRILLRDLLEITLSLGLACLFIVGGLRMPTAWPWFTAALLVLFVGAFFVGDRIRQRRSEGPASDSVRSSLATSLQRLEHQIWLLRKVGWWYLTPCFLAGVLIAVGVGLDLAGESQGRELPFPPWVAVLVIGVLSAALMIGVCWVIYHFNQKAVEQILRPRRDRLAGLLTELEGGAGDNGLAR
jgi:MFS family permease